MKSIMKIYLRHKLLQSFRGTDSAIPITKVDQNVTYTVCAIVTCFTLTQVNIKFLKIKKILYS